MIELNLVLVYYRIERTSDVNLHTYFKRTVIFKVYKNLNELYIM